jgi:ABC-2 type transport system permease protein
VIQGSLLAAVATRSFRRYSTYTAATVAGVITNSAFGIILSFIYIAVWKESPHAGGYDIADALTYTWLGQAILMPVAIWNGGTTDEFAERIRTGDIAIDFYRPVSPLAWYLASDLGRGCYHLLTRGLAPTIIGALLFDLRGPASVGAVLGLVAALPLAVVVSFGLRMVVATTTFWLLDDVGPRMLHACLAMFFCGLTVPLVLFPHGLRSVAVRLPWASFIQVPSDIWLGKREGWAILGGLGQSVLWAVLLLAAAGLLIRAGQRKLVVQGG